MREFFRRFLSGEPHPSEATDSPPIQPVPPQEPPATPRSQEPTTKPVAEKEQEQDLEDSPGPFRVDFSGNFDALFEHVRDLPAWPRYSILSKTVFGDSLLASEETSVMGFMGSGFSLPSFSFQTTLGYSGPKGPDGPPFYFSDDYVESIKQKFTNLGYYSDLVHGDGQHLQESPRNSYSAGKNILIVKKDKGFRYSLDFGFTNRGRLDSYLEKHFSYLEGHIHSEHPMFSQREFQQEFQQEHSRIMKELLELPKNALVLRSVGESDHWGGYSWLYNYWTMIALSSEGYFIERTTDYMKFYRTLVRIIYQFEGLEEPKIVVSFSLPEKVAAATDSKPKAVQSMKSERAPITNMRSESSQNEIIQYVVCSHCASQYQISSGPKGRDCPHCGAARPIEK